MNRRLADLLDRDSGHWQADLDDRYGGILDDVLSAGRPAFIYPAASMGRHAAGRLRDMGVDIVGFGDRDGALHGTSIDGLPVFTPDEIAADHRDAVVLVASTLYDSPITEALRSRGCAAIVPVAYLNRRLPDIFRARELEGAFAATTDPTNRPRIDAADRLFADERSHQVFAGKLAFYLGLDKADLDAIRSTEPIYFDPTVFAVTNDEVVVDGGAYTGDTLAAFLAHTAGRFRAYYAFEPDPRNLPPLVAMAARDPHRIVVEAAGLGRATTDGRLLSLNGFDSRLLRDDEPGGEQVALMSLDEYVIRRADPTLIKLDIEGMETEALRGAARVISRAAPVLAISAYHYPADLWSIPLLMAELMPEARIYLRHYTREFDDTVCYAVPAGRG